MGQYGRPSLATAGLLVDYPVNCCNILFDGILLHFCLESFYWLLHCDKKWGGGLRSLKASEFKKWGL